MKEVNQMFDIGERIFVEGIEKLEESNDSHLNSKYITDDIHNRRLATVNFTNGLELIFKAILVKKGFCIFKFSNQKKGTQGYIWKLNDKVEDIVKDEDKTIDISQVIACFKELYPRLPLDNVDKLRILRNNIVHRGTAIGEKKGIYFEKTIECLIEIYSREKIKHTKFIAKITEAKQNAFWRM